MIFTKMHGIGNDYVYVDCTKKKMANASEIAKFVSDRHFGIGGDGMILINSSDVADFEMEMYNADGSQGAMCGNGIRCVAKYVYDHGLTDKLNISINTKGGMKYLDLTKGPDGKISEVKVNMGSPILEPSKIPVAGCGRDKIVNLPITVDGREFRMTCVSMGNPHAVVFVDECPGFEGTGYFGGDESRALKSLDIEKIGPKFEFHEAFPDRVNTEFVRVIDRKTVEMRVWERGSGETLACGTGACAVAVSSVLNGYADDEVTVRLLGGDLKIRWDRDENLVYMTGSATTVFEGEIDLEEYDV